MKKIILIIGILLLSTQANAAYNRLWTAADQSRWDTMEAANSIPFARIKQYRNLDGYCQPNTQTGNSYGLIQALYFNTTGDTSYAKAAWDKLACFAGRTYGSGGVVPGLDQIRDQIIPEVFNFAYTCGGASPGNTSVNCNNFLDVLNFHADLIRGENHGGPFRDIYSGEGFRTSDTDQLVASCFGLEMLAKVIETNNPARAAEIRSGAWNIQTGSYCSGELFDRFINNYMVGGSWVEGSEYNLASEVLYMLNAYKALKDQSVSDPFPEITSKINDVATYFVNGITPDKNSRPSWGDVQENGLIPYRLVPVMWELAGLTGNENACYYANTLFQSDQNYRDLGWIYSDSTCTQTAPSTEMCHNASGMGEATCGDYSSANGTHVFSMFKPITFADHNYNGFHYWQLWKNQDLVMYSPSVYYGSSALEGLFRSTFLANGILPGEYPEARKEVAYDTNSSDYMLHVGIAGGHQYTDGVLDPPNETLHYYQESFFWYHHPNGADVVILFDRVNALNPFTQSDYSKQQTNFKNQITPVSGQHVFQLYTPSLPSLTSSQTYPLPDKFQWNSFSGTQTVNLDTYVPNYTHTEETLDSSNSNLFGVSSTVQATIKNRLRLLIPSSTQYQSVGNVLWSGGTETTSQITQSSGEAAKGYLIKNGTDAALITFNDVNMTSRLPTPSPIVNSHIVYNGNLINTLSPLRLNQLGSVINFTATTSSTKIFINDLDPSLPWTLSIDGGTANTITPSSAGLYTGTVSGTGSHTLSWATGTGATPTTTMSSVPITF